MSIIDINKILDLTPGITLKEKKIVQKTYPKVREEFKIENRTKEIEFLTKYIAFVRIGLIGA